MVECIVVMTTVSDVQSVVQEVSELQQQLRRKEAELTSAEETIRREQQQLRRKDDELTRAGETIRREQEQMRQLVCTRVCL